MERHRGTAEGTRRRAGEDHLFRHCYLRGPVGRAGRTMLLRMLSQAPEDIFFFFFFMVIWMGSVVVLQGK